MITTTLPTVPVGVAGAPAVKAPAEELVKKAQSFEAAILSEFLKATGVDRPETTFGGGIGEEQFSYFLLEARAQVMAARGGIGLAEMVLRSNGFNTLKAGERP